MALSATWNISLAVPGAIAVAATPLPFTNIPIAINNLLNWVAGLVGSLYSLAFQVDMFGINLYTPLATGFASMMLLLGVMLGVYIPLIPFVLFISGSINWLISTIESMVAAPLIAFGLANPEGHQLLGKAEQSLMLLLGIFIRPPAMVIGFLLGIILSDIAMEMFTLGYFNVMSQFFTMQNFQKIGPEGTMIVMMSLLIYGYIAIEVVQSSFSLIDSLPRELGKWIGAPSGFGGGQSQMLDSIKGKVQEMGQAGGQAASQGAKAPQISSPTAPSANLASGMKGSGEEKGADGGAEGEAHESGSGSGAEGGDGPEGGKGDGSPEGGTVGGG